MAIFSPSTRPLAWAGFVLIGFSCVWLVLLLIYGTGPEEEGEGAVGSLAAASAPAQAAQAAPASRPSPIATVLTPSAAIPGALHSAQTIDERGAAPTPAVGKGLTDAAVENAATLQPQATQAQAAAAPAHVAVAAAPAPPPPTHAAQAAPASTPAPAAKVESGPSPGALVAGLARRGHAVHASVSGHSVSTTLSVSGRTLTREDCIQWLAGARGGLRAAGVHIVVATNGAQSWTFML